MRTYAMYKGYKETKVPRNRVYIVGYYKTPTSHIVRCKGVEFVYSTRKTLLINWQFFAPVKEPVSIDEMPD